MDPLLLVSLSRYLDHEDGQSASRSKNAQSKRTAVAGDPKQPTTTLQQRLRPTWSSIQENPVILHTGLFISVGPLQKARPEGTQPPQGYQRSADPQSTRYPQVQQDFEQYPQGVQQPRQDSGQPSQSSGQFSQNFKQISHGSRHPAPPARQFSHVPRQLLKTHMKLRHEPWQASQGYRQPPQGFGQAPAQNFGQSPDGYPRLSGLGYEHEPASSSRRGQPQVRASHPEYRQAVAPKYEPAPAEPSWKRPTSSDNTLIISYRSPRGRLFRQTKVVLGALLGFAGLLYCFLH